MLYWVSAIKEPNKKQKEEEGKLPVLIMQPKIFIAKDEKVAALKALQESEELKSVNLDEIQVVVSPF